MSDLPRQATLAQLSAHLLQAAKVQHWDALEQADQAVAAQLPALAAQGPWSDAERAALQALIQAHDAARRAAAAAGSALAERIAQLQSGRDGWLAYALHSQESESTLS